MPRFDKPAMEERIKGFSKLNKARFYMVTFDLKGSAGREGIYSEFRTRLKVLLGRENVHRIIKQCYFVKASYHMRDVRREMQRSLGPNDSIIVVRLQPGYSFNLKVPGAANRAREYFGELKREDE